jgi:nickel/cobalt transporter (NicO) family protein
MNFVRTMLALTTLPFLATAHPMGNFSVNHYSRLEFHRWGIDLTYVLDLAEIPTFQLLGSWQAAANDQNLLNQRTREQAAEWLSNLELAEDHHKVSWQVRSIRPKTADGAGGMALLRIVIAAQAPLGAGRISYSDQNFPGRAGWKEIVIDHAPDALLHSASQGAIDRSAALTVYSTDPSITPPQDLTATVDWSPVIALTTSVKTAGAGSAFESYPTSRSEQQPVAPPVSPPAVTASSFAAQQPTAPGSVVRGDFLSQMLQRKNLGWRLTLFCLLAAFGLGAMHAMSPGHGKTIVAAYLVGSRGTLKHAGLLGFVVTSTHTFTVFLLGLGVLFFQQYVVPEKIIPVLGVLSGLSIVVVGISLLYRRAQALIGGGHHHHHHFHSSELRGTLAVATPALAIAHAGAANDHGHFHQHDYDHSQGHGFDHDYEHDHGSGLVHNHGGSAHSHMIEGDITVGSLVALGVGGGMVPCPSALILMLSAIALGRPAFGLTLLTAFSGGLSIVLIGIGILALYARRLLPDSQKASRHPAFRLIPVFSAVVVIVLGLAITAASAGWIQPLRFLS